MSLLLDALQRASLEKKKLAEARSGDPPAEPPVPVPSTFPELTLEPVEEPPAHAASYPDPASDSPSSVVANSLDNEAEPAPDLVPITERPAMELVATADATAVPESSSGQFLDGVPSELATVQSQPDKSWPAEPAAEVPVVGADSAHAQSPALDTRREPTGAVATNGTTPYSTPPPTPSRADPSPRIAREILAAHSPPKRKLATRTIVLGALIAVAALVNAAFFLGFFDSLLGTDDSVVGTGVAVAPPPAPAPPAEQPVPDAHATGAVPADAGALAGAESASPVVGQGAGTGAAAKTPPLPKPDVSEGKARERQSTPGAPRSPPTVLVSRPAPANPLQSAYEALRAGRYEEAGIAYRDALKSNPAERDALLGLAHLAHRAGSFDEARDLYQQVLRLDPEQPDAVAGLLSIASASDSASAASRIRDMAERSPQSPVAMSTLGSMLAREGRIGEAQQAFFQAYALDPENPLHAYNLAVALDRLHKYAQAREYYQRALALAEKGGTSRVAGFPVEQAQTRLEQLRGAVSEASEARPVALPAR